jgi:hypothetical protein
MAVLLKRLHPSAFGFERLSIGNRDFPVIEESENLFMVLRPRFRNLTQRPVDPFVPDVPPHRFLPAAIFSEFLW